jgi:hypothetical protein
MRSFWLGYRQREEQTMESWRYVWRHGFAPVLTRRGLNALREALESDDQRLTQGSTTTPPPLMCVHDWPVEATCALGFCGWQGERLRTVGDVEAYFSRCCAEADRRAGELGACRWFLNWFDDTPREQMRNELLAEVKLALVERHDTVVPATVVAIDDPFARTPSAA